MKSVFNMFKSKNTNSADQIEDIALSQMVSQKNNASTPLNKIEDKDDYYENENGDVFEEFTNKVQSLLDDGAASLQIAEEKTAKLTSMQPDTREYNILVEEVKIAQSQARQNFEDAEFLIKRANEILSESKNS
jgi:hypothetical protein